jgi:hypothetical protein
MPSEKFYKQCDVNFMPQYNETMYKDISFIIHLLYIYVKMHQKKKISQK